MSCQISKSKIREIFLKCGRVRAIVIISSLVFIVILSFGFPGGSDFWGCGGADDANTEGELSDTYRSSVVFQGNSNINECSASLDSCHDFAKCTDLKNGYKCQCPSGYNGDGTWCQSKKIALYVTPAIRSERLLPNSIPAKFKSRKISMRVSPGEYESASFFIRALKKFNNISLSWGDLSGASGSIPKDNIDVSIVKVWYQAGYDIADITHKQLAPELLLKDDSLVKVTKGKNYVKLSNGNYKWISEPDIASSWNPTPIPQLPIYDAKTLQPFSISMGSGKQIWVTVKITEETVPGVYNGSIVLNQGKSYLGEVDLSVEVLPILLSEPLIKYSIFYRSSLVGKTEGTISPFYKSPEQLRAELADLAAHGILYPTVEGHSNSAMLASYLNMREQNGIKNNPLYHLGKNLDSFGSDHIEIATQVTSLKNQLSLLGVSDLYIYGLDETDLNNETYRNRIQIVHDAGVKVFSAQFKEQATSIADMLDLAVVSGAPDSSLSALYKSHDHEVFGYCFPQMGVENPEIYRRNYGLRLWQDGYSGAMNFAYQFQFGQSIWNDFDRQIDPQSENNSTYPYRDHVMAYPTGNGVIGTIQWEGFREAVDDVRYLSTLINTLAQSNSSSMGSQSAKNLIGYLKTWANYDELDLDWARDSMIDHILHLEGNGPLPQYVALCGNGISEEGEACDDTDFNGTSCSDFDYKGGKLSCYTNCTIDVSGCTPPRTLLSFTNDTPESNSTVNGSSASISVNLDSTLPANVSILFDDDGPTAHWNFNQNINGSGVAQDISGNNYNATLRTDVTGTTSAGTNATTVKVTSPYFTLSYDNGYYNGWIFQITSGPAAGMESVINSYEVVFVKDANDNNINTEKTINLVDTIQGLAAGAAFRITKNDTLPAGAIGQFGGAIQLDGFDDLISVGSWGSSDAADYTDSLSVISRIKPTRVTGIQAIVSKNGPFFLELHDNLPKARIFAGGEWRYISAVQAISTENWYDLAMTYDGAHLKLYVNGALSASAEVSGVLSGNGCLQIGRANNSACEGNPNSYFAGLIDDVRIYNRALTIAEIAAFSPAHFGSLSRTLSNLSPGPHTFWAIAEKTDGTTVETEPRTINIQ